MSGFALRICFAMFCNEFANDWLMSFRHMFAEAMVDVSKKHKHWCYTKEGESTMVHLRK